MEPQKCMTVSLKSLKKYLELGLWTGHEIFGLGQARALHFRAQAGSGLGLIMSLTFRFQVSRPNKSSTANLKNP